MALVVLEKKDEDQLINKPVYAILLLFAYASSEGWDKPGQPVSLKRALEDHYASITI